MTQLTSAAAIGEDQPVTDPMATTPAHHPANVIKLTEEDFERKHVSAPKPYDTAGWNRDDWKAHERRVRAGDVLFRPNYNDDPDPAVVETVEKLVDTSRVIEVERLDLKALPKRRVFRFVKRAFDIMACSGALVLCAIPMGIIAIAVKLDSPGPVFYSQERLGWSIIGQKSGAASDYAFRPAPSALEANSCRGILSAFEGRPVIPFEQIASNSFAFSQVKNVHESSPRDKRPGVAA